MTTVTRVGEWMRRRELAGDDRAGSWARGQARRAQREFLRENWWVLLGCVVFAVALAIAVGEFSTSSPYVQGVLLGAALVGAPMLVWGMVVQVTGTAPIMMGDQAEQWTAQELRRAAGSDWRLVNHLALNSDDIDHVLVGPGGCLVFETKWSGSSWASAYGRDRLEQAVSQARRNARSLRLWHPFKSRGIAVTPVVVLWGRGLSKWPDHERVRVFDDVVVVTGGDLRDWMSSHDVDRLDATAVDEAFTAMDAHSMRRDPVEERDRPVPVSLMEWMTRVGFAVAAGVAAAFAVPRILSLIPNDWLAAGTLLVFALTAVLVARRVRVPHLAWAVYGWATVCGLFVAALITLAVKMAIS